MSYRIEINEQAGRVEVVVHRVCDPREIAEDESRLLKAAAQARADLGRLRLIIDSRQVGPLPNASVERLMLLEEKLVTRDDDRIAVVVESSLAKVQLARFSKHKQVNRFVSPTAADTWLSAHDGHGYQAQASVRAIGQRP
ncbi:hypothetical protein [Sphingomonas aerophila]|uniref:STAS/SEC14 domain-containing protein n=1 Tax=Sphingomonas aerophila TaxID=1344948 RepID=A0A7W9BBU2_9SPHN|nr:hypothetical protein [Sphingomonas aerophila]MBB5714133.1 hypothetical protein [Sphingomonas aerophila]